PARVNSEDGSAIATGTIRGGQMADGRGGRVHVTWNGSGSTSQFLYSRSNTEETAFEPQRNLLTRTTLIDGGRAIAADGNGGVYAAWHAVASDGPRGEDHRQVWIARSTDDGVRFSAEEPAWSEPTGACGCCGLRMLARGDSLLLLYRSAFETMHRDVYLLASRDRGRSFRGSRVQEWPIGACPMTSMSLTTAGARTLGAWETAGQVYAGEIDADAARIAAPIAAPGESAGRKHPRLAAQPTGETLFVWTEGTAWARGGSIAWQRYDGALRPMGPVERAAGVPAWSFAAPAAHDGSFIIFY